MHSYRTHSEVLAVITKVGDNGCNTASRGTTNCICHNKQFHEVVVSGVAGGLNDKNVFASNVFMNFYGNFAILKSADICSTDWNVKLAYHGLSQFRVGITGKDNEFGHERPLRDMALKSGLETLRQDGCGTRTRTWERRDQNPLPYQLGYTPTLTLATTAVVASLLLVAMYYSYVRRNLSSLAATG